jgi:hypothetical protein
VEDEDEDEDEDQEQEEFGAVNIFPGTGIALLRQGLRRKVQGAMEVRRTRR